MPKSAVIPACPSDLKYTNRIQVIRACRDGAPHTVGDIATVTGLSRQTVTKSIQFFLDTGLLASAGKRDTGVAGGKPPEQFVLSGEKYFLCLSLWPKDQRITLITIGNQVTDALHMTDPLPDDPAEAIRNLCTRALELLACHGVAQQNLCAISLSTAGILNYHTGHLKYSSQSPAWGTDVPLAALMRQYFRPGIPVFLENAGKMTARSLLFEPELEQKRALVLFTCWGLSSCLIEKGSILNGRNSLIGEIGHMVVSPTDEEQCGCGGHGCLERLTSVDRIRRLIAQEAAHYPTSSLLRIPPETLTLRDVFDASAGCDPLAQKLSDYLAQLFATALRNVSLVFDPDLIVFQGDYAFADPRFDAQLRKWLGQFQYFPADGPFEIRYDRRELAQLDTQGSYIALMQIFLAAPELYRERKKELDKPATF